MPQSYVGTRCPTNTQGGGANAPLPLFCSIYPVDNPLRLWTIGTANAGCQAPPRRGARLGSKKGTLNMKNLLEDILGVLSLMLGMAGLIVISVALAG